MVVDDFQAPKGDLALYCHDDFQSYLEVFDEYSYEHLNLFHEEDYRPPLCSDINKGEDIAFPKKDPYDDVFHLPLTILSRYITKGVAGKYVLSIKFSLRQSLLLEFKGRLNTSRRSISSESFNLPLRTSQSPSRFLLFPSQTSDCEDFQGSQPSDSLSQSIGPLTFHDPFLRLIDHSPESMTWHDFVPPFGLHELDLMIFDNILHSLTHVIFVLDLSLFWFMMKHRGMYCETLLGWFHWIFDYT